MGDDVPDPGAAARGAASGAAHGAMELVDVLFEWIVPLVFVIVGFALGTAIGLSGAVWTLVDAAVGNSGLSSTVVNYIANFAAILIWAGIGAALWSAQHSAGGKIGMYILRPIATLFWGFALSEVPNLFGGTVSNGSIGKMADSVHLTQGA